MTNRNRSNRSGSNNHSTSTINCEKRRSPRNHPSSSAKVSSTTTTTVDNVINSANNCSINGSNPVTWVESHLRSHRRRQQQPIASRTNRHITDHSVGNNNLLEVAMSPSCQPSTSPTSPPSSPSSLPITQHHSSSQLLNSNHSFQTVSASSLLSDSPVHQLYSGSQPNMYADLKAFERRLMETILQQRPKERLWRIVLATSVLVTTCSSYFWLHDSLLLDNINNKDVSVRSSYETLSFFESLCVHYIFTINAIILIVLLFIGAHRRIMQSRIITNRARSVLHDFALTCDDNGKLIMQNCHRNSISSSTNASAAASVASMSLTQHNTVSSTTENHNSFVSNATNNNNNSSTTSTASLRLNRSSTASAAAVAAASVVTQALPYQSYT